jgi:hypothetical protein
VKQDGGTSQLDALAGSVRAVVTERYGSKGSSFQMKTPTAVAGVRGTGFVALVDSDGKRTRVIGLYDTTFVCGLVDPACKHEVQVHPMQMTEVLAGGLPSKPQTLPRAQFDALVADTESGGPAAGTPPPPGAAGEGGGPPEEGSGNPGDPATPDQPGGGSIRRPDGKIEQPIDQLRGPKEPPPPPPHR